MNSGVWWTETFKLQQLEQNAKASDEFDHFQSIGQFPQLVENTSNHHLMSDRKRRKWLNAFPLSLIMTISKFYEIPFMSQVLCQKILPTLFSLLFITVLQGRYYSHHFTPAETGIREMSLPVQGATARFSCWFIFTSSHLYPPCCFWDVVTYCFKSCKMEHETAIRDILVVLCSCMGSHGHIKISFSCVKTATRYLHYNHVPFQKSTALCFPFSLQPTLFISHIAQYLLHEKIILR